MDQYAFDADDADELERQQNRLLPLDDPQEMREWQEARLRAQDAGCECSDESMCHTCINQDRFLEQGQYVRDQLDALRWMLGAREMQKPLYGEVDDEDEDDELDSPADPTDCDGGSNLDTRNHGVLRPALVTQRTSAEQGPRDETEQAQRAEALESQRVQAEQAERLRAEDVQRVKAEKAWRAKSEKAWRAKQEAKRERAVALKRTLAVSVMLLAFGLAFVGYSFWTTEYGALGRLGSCCGTVVAVVALPLVGLGAELWRRAYRTQPNVDVARRVKECERAAAVEERNALARERHGPEKRNADDIPFWDR